MDRIAVNNLNEAARVLRMMAAGPLLVALTISYHVAPESLFSAHPLMIMLVILAAVSFAMWFGGAALHFFARRKHRLSPEVHRSTNADLKSRAAIYYSVMLPVICVALFGFAIWLRYSTK